MPVSASISHILCARRSTWLAGLLLLALVLACFLYVPEAHAAGTSGGWGSGCPANGSYTARVVDCVERGIKEAIPKFLVKLSAYMRPIRNAAITLATCIFGTRILAGENDPKQLGIKFILRVAFVLYFTDHLVDWVDPIFGMMNDILRIVTAPLKSVTSIHCPGSGPPHLEVWNQMDCLVGTVLGFGPKAVGVALDAFLGKYGVLGIIGMLAFSRTFGLYVFVAGVTAIFSLVFMVARAVYTYLLAIGILGIMLVVMQLVLPCLLFKSTRKMVFASLDQITSAMTQAILLFAMLPFVMLLLDKALFDGSNALMNVLNLDWSSVIRTDKPLFPFLEIPTDPVFWAKAMPTVPGSSIVGSVPDVLNPLHGKTFNPLGFIKVPTIDFGSQHAQKLQQLGFAFLAIALLTFTVNAFIKKIPEWSRMLTHSSLDVTEGAKPMPFQGLLEKLSGQGEKPQAMAAQAGSNAGDL